MTIPFDETLGVYPRRRVHPAPGLGLRPHPGRAVPLTSVGRVPEEASA